MNRGPFAKIYRSLWDGSLGQQPEAWAIFVIMLTHCDANGVVQMTPAAIAARSGFPLDFVKRGITVLEQPDPESRTPESEGKRITRLDPHRSWGWQIVNYQLYRRLDNAERVAAYRERKASTGSDCNAPTRDVTPRYQAEAEADAERTPHSPDPTAQETAPAPSQAHLRPSRDEHPKFEAFFAAYPRRAARRAASLAFKGALRRHRALDAQQLVRAAEGYARSTQSTDLRYVPHPARWLTEDRFLEQLQRVTGSPNGPGGARKKPLFTPEEEAPPSEADKARARAFVSEVTAKLSSG
jgi:hypothetical protein